MSPVSSILETLFDMRAIHRELNTSIPPHSRNGEASHPQNTGEKIKPRKRTERTGGRWSLFVPPPAYASRVALLYQNLLMLRINRSHPAQ